MDKIQTTVQKHIASLTGSSNQIAAAEYLEKAAALLRADAGQATQSSFVAEIRESRKKQRDRFAASFYKMQLEKQAEKIRDKFLSHGLTHIPNQSGMSSFEMQPNGYTFWVFNDKFMVKKGAVNKTGWTEMKNLASTIEAIKNKLL